MKCIVLKQWMGLQASPEPQDIPGGIAIELQKRGFLRFVLDDEEETSSVAPPETTMKRGRGRPRGSKNKVKANVVNA